MDVLLQCFTCGTYNTPMYSDMEIMYEETYSSAQYKPRRLYTPLQGKRLDTIQEDVQEEDLNPTQEQSLVNTSHRNKNKCK